MKNRYTYFTLVFTALSAIIIYILSLTSFDFKKNEVLFCFFLQVIFASIVLVMGLKEVKKHNFAFPDFKKIDNLIHIALLGLLISTVFRPTIGAWITGIFVLLLLINFIINKRFYQINKTYYLLFIYALLQVIGTVGTRKGFYFPDILLSFFVLPIAYSFFDFKEQSLRNIAAFFLRIMILFLAICIIYWWYNFLFLDDVTFLKWISSKMLFPVNPSVLFFQGTDFPFDMAAAYFFVEGWSFYYNPTYTSFVVLCALIIGFYLRYNNHITNVELGALLFFSGFVILLNQSRVGFIGFFFVIFISFLYYTKLQTNKFKLILSVLIVLLCALFYVSNDIIAKFTNDVNREYIYVVSTSYVKEHFWWGCGFQQEIYAIAEQGEKMKDVISNPGAVFLHAHNQFLGEMMKYGIWGLLSITTLFISLFIYAIRTRSYLLQLFLLVFILFMLIEEPFILQDGVTRFTVFLTLFMAFAESGKRKEISLTSKELLKK